MLDNTKLKKSTTTKGLEKGWVRSTVILEEEVLEKARDYAYWERLKLKIVINTIIKEFLADKSVRKRPQEERNRTDFIKLAKLDRASDEGLI